MEKKILVLFSLLSCLMMLQSGDAFYIETEEENVSFDCPELSGGCSLEVSECEYGPRVDEEGCIVCECAEPAEGPELSQCEKEAIDSSQNLDSYHPACQTDGSYSPLQCYHQDCWCVDSQSGVEVPGTRKPIAEGATHMDCSSSPDGNGTPPPKTPL